MIKASITLSCWGVKVKKFALFLIPMVFILGSFSSVDAAIYRATASFASINGVACPSAEDGPCPAGTDLVSLSTERENRFEVFFGWEFVGPGSENARARNLVFTFGIVFPTDFLDSSVQVPEELDRINAARGDSALSILVSPLFPDLFSRPAEGNFQYSDAGPDQGVLFTTGTSHPQMVRVTYVVPANVAAMSLELRHTGEVAEGADSYSNNPTFERQIIDINLVPPRILAELRLNGGVPGGTLELTTVIADSTDTRLVAASGETCLQSGTCQVVTSFSTPVTVVIPAGTFPSSVSSCGETACTRRSEEQNLDITSRVAAADFSNGMASVVASSTLQYDLADVTVGDGFFSADIMINGEDFRMRVTVVADQTPPTVPEGFALSCTPTAYSAFCSWPAGAEDPSPGAGLDDFELEFYPAAAADSTPTSCMALGSARFIAGGVIENMAATTAAFSVEFTDLRPLVEGRRLEPGTRYFACLYVEDIAFNPAEGSPFQADFTTLEYRPGLDEGGNGVPDDLDVFAPDPVMGFANLQEAVAMIGGDADGNATTDSIAFVYGLPSQVPDFGTLERLTCNPDYARGASANLETSCADVLGDDRMGWIIHVANGVLYPPTTAPPLAEMPRASGKYLISHLNEDRTIASLAVLTVLPQLGISYPVDGEGLALAPPDENPRDANPANDAAEPNDPTKFQVAVLFGDGIPGDDSQDGAIPTTVTLSLAIVHAPATAPEPMPIPSASSLTALTVAVATLASTDTELVEYTGIHMAPANTVMFSGDGIENVNALATSFTLTDSDVDALDFINIMLTDVVGASSQTNIVCSTPQEGGDLVGAPMEVTPDAFSCTVSTGGDPFEVEIADSGGGGGGGMLGWLSLIALAALTMLSGLVRRRGIALAAALFLAAGLSPAAFAQPSTLSDPSHWRLGVDIGLGLIDPHSSNDESRLDVDEDSDFGWRISLEHDSLFHKDVGLEIFWADLGEAEVSGRERPENFSAEVEADIFGIGAVWHLRDMDFVADWSPYGSLGYRYVDGELSGRSGRDSDDATFDVEHENGVYWNIGVEGSVYRDWNLLGRAFYEAYDEDLGFWGVGLVWHLGESSAPPRKRDKPRRSASRKKAEPSSSARRESSRRAASSRRDMAAAGECKVPKGMTPEGWYVQVITYASADRARSMQNQLRRDDYTVGVADRGDLHAVRVLTDTCAQAQRIKRQLGRKLGVEPFVRPYTSHAY